MLLQTFALYSSSSIAVGESMNSDECKLREIDTDVCVHCWAG